MFETSGEVRKRCFAPGTQPGLSLRHLVCVACGVDEVTSINGILSGAEEGEMYTFLYIHI